MTKNDKSIIEDIAMNLLSAMQWMMTAGRG